ncbi:MAG: helix-turn-helix transcriptional regulator [Planctomycetaceae bacterium]|nr:helix-turn-helix transcriptional regulator [Planctomycetaceae bacterium]
MIPIEKAFGITVRKLRTRLGLSQEDFADKAGIHRTYVSAIELGKVQVSIAVAMKLAMALEVSVAKLWTDVEKAMRSST